MVARLEQAIRAGARQTAIIIQCAVRKVGWMATGFAPAFSEPSAYLREPLCETDFGE
jgi:hypothetical protein